MGEVIIIIIIMLRIIITSGRLAILSTTRLVITEGSTTATMHRSRQFVMMVGHAVKSTYCHWDLGANVALNVALHEFDVISIITVELSRGGGRRSDSVHTVPPLCMDAQHAGRWGRYQLIAHLDEREDKRPQQHDTVQRTGATSQSPTVPTAMELLIFVP